jgi:Ecdysteroid kinase-like family
MEGQASPIIVPRTVDGVDASFMTDVLRRSGVIDATNEVVSQVESGVGMTAGYFSSIKKVKCQYRRAVDAQDSFVVKGWPTFEILPKDNLEAIFVRDIKAYSFPAETFFPRPRTYLAAFDRDRNGWVLVMEDVDTFGDHKVHELEMTFDDVERMIPGLVDVAVAWEGCDGGDQARQLADIGVDLWVSQSNLDLFKTVMPGGAKLFDKLTTLKESTIMAGRGWDEYLGGPGIAEMLTSRLDAFFKDADPSCGGTCTLCHGDLRGDNIFFCEPTTEYPHGWLCIDFQLMFRGPVPTDLAYLLTSGSVLPDVYSPPTLFRLLHRFYDLFMAKTHRYPDYSYDSFLAEFRMMSVVMLLYYVGMGAATWRQSAWENTRGARVELGGQGATEADLAPEELRQRMWWRKTIANIGVILREFDLYQHLEGLPTDRRGLGAWTEPPDHLR